ncbi:hypothetical protein Gasu2_01270 [Galdieria sulphuraria]|nr:hypothetical protein Gasu2_01270 [Galdieria sulphuraria]
MSNTGERTTLPLFGFRAVRKSPKRKRSKKYPAELECLSNDSLPTERVVLSDSDVQTAHSSSELKPDDSDFPLPKYYSDYRGYETEPISPKTPPMSATWREKLATPKAPKKGIHETRNISLFEQEDREGGGICRSCGRICRLRPSVPER